MISFQVATNKAQVRHKKWQQKRNKSRGEVGPTECRLCGIKVEDGATFQTIHLEELRHKYNYMLAIFKKRSVFCTVCCPICECYIGKFCNLSEISVN
jgi:hypothetical protein